MFGLILAVGTVIGVMGKAFYVTRDEYNTKNLRDAEESTTVKNTLDRVEKALSRQEASFDKLSDAVQAIKVGALSSTEAVSAVAQIAADYSQVPLVLHLGLQALDSEEIPEEDDAEDLTGATIELLVPQAHVVVLEAARLAQWITEDVLEASGQTTGPQALQAIGANWVLVTGSLQRPGHRVNVLVGPDNETISWPWTAPPDRVRDSGGIVATAIAALLAHGLTVPEAARQACTYAEQALAQSFQPGMGNRIARRIPATS